jgi:hypothetical protein
MVAEVIEHLPSIHEALGSIPSMTKTKVGRSGEGRNWEGASVLYCCTANHPQSVKTYQQCCIASYCSVLPSGATIVTLSSC